LLRIGFLIAESPAAYANQVAGFRLGLSELGYLEGTNTIIVYRAAEGHYERLPELATELVRSNVDVIVTHGTPGTLAAKHATTTIPIVAAVIGDPVASGAVASVGRPGGNITGSSVFSPEVSAKRIELLREVSPRIVRVAILVNPENPLQADVRASESAARSLGVRLQRFPVRTSNEFGLAFDRMEQEHVEAITVLEEALFNANLDVIAARATKQRLLSIGSKEFGERSGLIGYGADFFALFRRAAVFVDKILKGRKPADIPIEQATKFEFVLNLKTAAAIGIDVPTSTLLRADKVIE
jgi:putative ABC transport system substrate-binding protein